MVARAKDGQVTRVEISIFDMASGFELNNGPNPVTTFAPNGAWSATWDTSDLIHDQQYDLVVRAYDGEDYSQEVRNRIIIDNPTDLNNLAPIFNDTGWASTVTIFCDADSSSIDRCGAGAVIDLTQFFSDPDGIGSTSDALVFDIYDDLSNLEDDDYMYYINLDSQGIATYNPPYVQSGSAVTEWSLIGVMFEARDIYDSVVYSYKINFVVKSVSFSVERVDSGEIAFDNPAVFRGQGLPGSTVEALIQQGGLRVNSTRVLSDGTWEMQISMNQLNTEGSRNIIFEMDDQVFALPGENSDALFQLSVGDGEDSNSNIGLIAAIIVGIILLLGVGMFFLQVEYEDLDEAAELLASQEKEAVDPYAWTKNRQDPVALPSSQVAMTPVPAQSQVAAAPQAAQHPGWIWDAESNNWVPDPNYTPNQ